MLGACRRLACKCLDMLPHAAPPICAQTFEPIVHLPILAALRDSKSLARVRKRSRCYAAAMLGVGVWRAHAYV